MAKERLVYGLCDPRDGTVRYVGKSSSGLRRAKNHMFPSIRKREFGRKRNWLQGLVDAGLEPTIEVLERVETAEELNDAECFWIAHLRSVGAQLYNRKEGGESDTASGYTHPDEIRAKIGNARRGMVLPRAWVDKMAATKRGSKQTAATIAKRSAGMMGHAVSDETKRKLSLKNSGHPVSDEQRLAISRSLGMRPFKDETGRVYQTQAEAARELGVGRPKISLVLSGKRRHTGGHTFVYVDSEPPADD